MEFSLLRSIVADGGSGKKFICAGKAKLVRFSARLSQSHYNRKEKKYIFHI